MNGISETQTTLSFSDVDLFAAKFISVLSKRDLHKHLMKVQKGSKEEIVTNIEELKLKYAKKLKKKTVTVEMMKYWLEFKEKYISESPLDAFKTSLN
ncbi:MAG TPA: hypothetical protein PLZ15_09230 [Melioribacteraceae bacterium]|nr:hypothetical protein [Melioribacteraceae bacterium]